MKISLKHALTVALGTAALTATPARGQIAPRVRGERDRARAESAQLRFGALPEIAVQIAEANAALVASWPAIAFQVEEARAQLEAHRPEVQAALQEAEAVMRGVPAVPPMPVVSAWPMVPGVFPMESALPVMPAAPTFPMGRAPAGPPAPWLQQDPADSLYRAAREALNRRDFQRAADEFAAIRVRFPRSGYVPDTYYFQAFALQRIGSREADQRAVALLDEQRRTHPNATTRGDADQLRLRLQGTLAQAGNAQAAAAVEDAARAGCDDADQELRATALSALVTMDSNRALPLLREILNSRDECSVELRRQSLFLISRASPDQALDILLDLAQRNPDPDPEVRQQAVFWLSRVRTPEATTALEGILQRATDAEMQQQAVYALSQQKTARSMQVLKTYAERADAPTELRAQVIFWLGSDSENGGSAYIRQLYPRLNEAELRSQVMAAVARSGTAEDRAWLIQRAKDSNEDIEVRKQALFWAGRTGLAVADLRAMYDELQDSEVRQQVIFVLSRSEGSAAVEALIDIATNERDKELRQQAVFWLGRSEDPRAAEYLMRLIRGGR